MGITDHVDLLIGQWRDAPRLRGLAVGILGLIQEELIDPLKEAERMGNLEEAEGVWLDRIGQRLGVARASSVDADTSTEYFGFAGGGFQGFDQGPFYSLGAVLETSVVDADDDFRGFVRVRSSAALNRLSIEEIANTIKAAGIETVHVQDCQNMEASLYVAPQHATLLNKLLAEGLVPKPDGVRIDFGREPLLTFGFHGSGGTGFSQGVFN